MNLNPKRNPVPGEPAEPVGGDGAISIWLIAALGVLFCWGQFYLGRHAGGFERAVYYPYRSLREVAAANPRNKGDRVIAMGRDVFTKTCSVCHQPNGMGKPVTAPPLAGSEWVLAPGPNRIAHAILNGLTGPITVQGKDWNLTMVPWKDVYDDEHLAATLTYIRNSWGNKAPPVKPEEIAAARKDIHPGPETAPEITSMPEKLPGM
jgi:mono/diheme cytochrome c family protein